MLYVNGTSYQLSDVVLLGDNAIYIRSVKLLAIAGVDVIVLE